ncbi:hypothetical protein QCE63_12855 [Caballeronia sp. LZ065]|uniref:hypothetical protein n=1 Tax=Caballeronia sp. LZ065 TaxID=3038571 RepID=UPI0028605DC1|nr:hypothetical protein [Caballeronia sp. LZ065]MDR5780310.1 hypothetical protein [Caballeronia sp. LZ065]
MSAIDSIPPSRTTAQDAAILLLVFFPRAFADSATATHVPVVSFHTVRYVLFICISKSSIMLLILHIRNSRFFNLQALPTGATWRIKRSMPMRRGHWRAMSALRHH